MSGLSDELINNQDLIKPWVVLKLNEEDSWKLYGPFSEDEVRQQLRDGNLKPSDYCWTSGWSNWQKIYLEPKFYLSRKPPIEIGPVKTKKVNIKSIEMSDISLKDGDYKMLEPWDEKIKSLDFEEEVQKQSIISDLQSGFEDFRNESLESKSSKTRFVSLKFVIILGIFAILSFAAFKIYTLFSVPSINFNMSYFVIEEYSNELPEYLYARTDLKKNQQIKIRVFDLSNKQIRTKNSKDGLILTSKGSGRMRLPMYAYSLVPGVYKINVEVEDQVIEKEFNVVR